MFGKTQVSFGKTQVSFGKTPVSFGKTQVSFGKTPVSFGIKNHLHFFSLMIFSVITCFYLYSRCQTHEEREDKTVFQRLLMNYTERRRYRDKLYCSFNKGIVLFFALLVPFVFLDNIYQEFALKLFLIFGVLILLFGFL